MNSTINGGRTGRIPGFAIVTSAIVVAVLGIAGTSAHAFVPPPHLHVCLPRCVAPTPPSITNVSPTTAEPAQTVTVTGQNFGATQGTGYLQFSDNGVNWGAPGDAAAFKLESWTNTQIVFELPTPTPYTSWGTTPGTQATVTVTNSSGLQSNQVNITMVPPPTFPTPAPAIDQRWAGYVATGETYTYVSGSWTVPTANCGTVWHNFTLASDAATWVGIDGEGTNTVEQIGTDSNCIANQGAYWAWFEMAPNLPVIIDMNSYGVSPGDQMDGSVMSTGEPGWYTLRLGDVTKNWNYQTTQYLAGATGGSAEWITEQPEVLSIPLTNFGTVNFTACYAGGSFAPSYDSSIEHHQNTAFNMENGSGTLQAVTSPLSPDGTSFNITWEHN